MNTADNLDRPDIHLWFGLSYANYLVVPRTLLQSMPDTWQRRFVAMLDELAAAFDHIPQADAYEVTAGEERIVGDMTGAELALAGVTRTEGPCTVEHDHDEAEGADCWPEYSYHHNRDGRELDRHERVILPKPDPVPHYNRGRTHIEPRLPLPVPAPHTD